MKKNKESKTALMTSFILLHPTLLWGPVDGVGVCEFVGSFYLINYQIDMIKEILAYIYMMVTPFSKTKLVHKQRFNKRRFSKNFP